MKAFTTSYFAGKVSINISICFTAIIRSGTNTANTIIVTPPITRLAASGRFILVLNLSTSGLSEHASTYDAKNNMTVVVTCEKNFISITTIIRKIIFLIVTLFLLNIKNLFFYFFLIIAKRGCKINRFIG